MGLVTHDRAADVGAVGVQLRLRLVEPVLLDEEVLLREARILPQPGGNAMKRVRPLLADGIDDRTRGASELRIVLVGDDLEFGDRLERRARLRSRALSNDIVVVVGAVEHEVVIAGVQTVHADSVGPERLGADVGNDPWQQGHHAHEVAVDRRQHRHLAIGDVAADFFRRQIDEWRLRGDRHCLGELTDAELYVDRRRSPKVEPHIASGVLREARELSLEGVQTRRDCGDEVRAVRSADGLAKDAGSLIGDGECGARHRRILRVEHAPAELGRTFLAECLYSQGHAASNGEQPNESWSHRKPPPTRVVIRVCSPRRKFTNFTPRAMASALRRSWLEVMHAQEAEPYGLV